MRALRTIADSNTDVTLTGDGDVSTRERTAPFLNAPPWLWLILGLGALQLAIGVAGFVAGLLGFGVVEPAIWERAGWTVRRLPADRVSRDPARLLALAPNVREVSL